MDSLVWQGEDCVTSKSVEHWMMGMGWPGQTEQGMRERKKGEVFASYCKHMGGLGGQDKHGQGAIVVCEDVD